MTKDRCTATSGYKTGNALISVVSWVCRCVITSVTIGILNSLFCDISVASAQPSVRPFSESVVINARKLNLEGMAMQSRGDLENAAKEYQQAIDLCPDVAAYHNNLALALKDMNRLEEAKQEEVKAISLKGYKGSYHYNLGIILQRINDLEGAEHEFRIATERDALDCDFRYRLAQALLQLKRSPQAEEEARMLTAANPQEASYHKLLADALYDENKTEDALYEYRRALELKPFAPDSSEIKNRIASIRESLGLH